MKNDDFQIKPTVYSSNLKRRRVVLGMSGGVDSSVAAILLKEQGYDVIGVHMKYWSEKSEYEVCENGIVNNDPSRANACCSLDSLEDARRVCAKLNIPLYVVDFKEKFKEKIVDLFVDELKKGFTPNACVVCNRDIKFGLLLDYALSIGAEYVATGHYAQLFFDEELSRFGIKEALDKNKDQSYFLSLLSQKQFSHMILPLGGMNKEEVRKIAEENGLVNSKRRDSQDLCFIANDYRSFVKKYVSQIPGRIILKEGREIIGNHDGLAFYTIGQRKGLNTKINKPLYVYSKDFENNSLVVDFISPSGDKKITLKDFNFILENIEGFKNLSFVGRYQGTKFPIKDFFKDENDIIISFDELKSNFANGQYGAIYADDILVGSGKIMNL